MAARIADPYIMTRDNVKTYLQISTTDYDTLIDTYLPIVSKDIELITNNSFIVDAIGDITNGSDEIDNFDSLLLIEVGHVISSRDFTNNTITAIDDDDSIVTISANASSDITDADIKVNVFPVAKRPIAAAMVMHNIKKYTETIDLNGPLKSESVGSYSWTAASDGKGTSGYPEWIVRGLSDISRPRFY